MPIQVDCPRCKRPLSVPESQAGSYLRCPNCRGRLWVPSEDEQRDSWDASPTSPEPTPAAEPARPATVARFLSTAPGDSYLKLADDGKLPELRLPEAGTAASNQQARRGMNPLVMTALCCLSAIASLALVVMPNDPGPSDRSQAKQRAWAAIEESYFSEMDGLPHEPYQFQLRDAQRAHLRGDYRQERELYRRVLEMLRAERKPATGVTGSPRRDQELERHLQVLLGK